MPRFPLPVAAALVALLFVVPFASASDTISSDSTKQKKIRMAEYPILGFQPETSFLFGAVGLFVFNLQDSIDSTYNRPSSVAPAFIYTLNKQVIITPRIELNMTNRYQISLKGTYRFYPNEFYGVGNEAQKADLEQFTESKYTLETRFLRIFNRKYFAGLFLFMESNTLSDPDAGGLLEARDYVGEAGGFNMGFGPSMKVDTRDDILFPTKGKFVQFDAVFFPNLNFNDYNYRFYELDSRTYKGLGERHVLAFRMRLSGQFGNSIPFYQLPKLGGTARLRGIRANQFINEKAYLMQAEHRMNVYKRLGLNLAVGVGDVAKELSHFELNEIKYSLAAGLRFRLLKKDRVNLAIDYGITQNRQGEFYLAIGEAF